MEKNDNGADKVVIIRSVTSSADGVPHSLGGIMTEIDINKYISSKRPKPLIILACRIVESST
jgi:hypothetical protein